MEVDAIAKSISADLVRTTQTDRLTQPVMDGAALNADGPAASAKTLGELFVASEAYRGWSAA